MSEEALHPQGEAAHSNDKTGKFNTSILIVSAILNQKTKPEISSNVLIKKEWGRCWTTFLAIFNKISQILYHKSDAFGKENP